ncbi:25726_t:CDS:1, partial [Gigaspora rosea]
QVGIKGALNQFPQCDIPMVEMFTQSLRLIEAFLLKIHFLKWILNFSQSQ